MEALDFLKQHIYPIMELLPGEEVTAAKVPVETPEIPADTEEIPLMAAVVVIREESRQNNPGPGAVSEEVFQGG